MLRGRFGDTSGRPYIEGRRVLPRLGLTGDISFLLDTGADKSVLMPLDAERLGVDYKRLRNRVETVGIGGTSVDFREPALMAFNDPGHAIFVYRLKIHVAAPRPALSTIPSLAWQGRHRSLGDHV